MGFRKFSRGKNRGDILMTSLWVKFFSQEVTGWGWGLGFSVCQQQYFRKKTQDRNACGLVTLFNLSLAGFCQHIMRLFSIDIVTYRMLTTCRSLESHLRRYRSIWGKRFQIFAHPIVKLIDSSQHFPGVHVWYYWSNLGTSIQMQYFLSATLVTVGIPFIGQNSVYDTTCVCTYAKNLRYERSFLQSSIYFLINLISY